MNRIWDNCIPYFFLVISLLPTLYGENKKYPLTNDPIDVVIVCHEKDVRTLDSAIWGIKRNCKNIRKIIVVSAKDLTEFAEWFNESQYPFTKQDIAFEIFQDKKKSNEFLQSPSSRIGWIYQQLLKLYAPFVIPSISSNVLILDADTIFLRPVEFIDQSGCTLFNISREYNPFYFEHGARLISGFKKIYPQYSGITHHMLFQKPILENFFTIIKKIHNTEPWRAICRTIDITQINGSTVSEYELYFNFAFSQTKQVKIRMLNWKESFFEGNMDHHSLYPDLDYVSLHSWMQKTRPKYNEYSDK